MDRRDFLRKGTAAAGLAASQHLLESGAAAKPTHSIARRTLGKTGEHLSIIGMGGIVVMNAEQSHANNIVAEAHDRGINYFDVAPSYGNAQERLGPALKPYRSKVFLACKTGKFDKAGSEAALNESLRLLKTDHVDLYQLHALTHKADLEKALGPGGALETFVAARKAGKIRYLGFSAHSVETAIAAMESFHFDTILFPTNFVLFSQAHFGPTVIEHARSKGMGILCIKAMAKTKWPEGTSAADRQWKKCWYEPCSMPQEASLALRWTLGRPITAAVPPGEEKFFRLAMDVAQSYKPLSAEEEKTLLASAAGVAPIFQLGVS
jgi:aryl-alcohol dehydrogenase-like predicted oxidoreductase